MTLELQDILAKIEDPMQLINTFVVNSPIGIQIYNASGYSIYVNDRHKCIFGAAPPPDYCVLKDSLVASAGLLHLIHKAFAGESAELPLLWYDARDLENVDTDYTRAYGKKCAIETRMVPVFDRARTVTHVLFIFKDVTAELFMKQERERALKERDDANTLIKTVLDRTQAVVYIKDLSGKFIFVNGQFCRIFEKSAEQILGKADHQIFPREVADQFRKNDLRVQKSGQHTEVEEVAQHADGKEHTYLSLKFPLLDSAGALYGVCGISTDITQRRKFEHELGMAKRMEAVGLLAGGIAHDFNNVLGIILLHADLLLRAGETPKLDWRTELDIIKSSAQKASLLTRQLLAIGRRQKVETRTLNVNTIVLGMKEMLREALGEDVRFETDVDQAAWPVRIDPLQIEQILTNLCLNARDAMPKGGGLSVFTRNVRLGPEYGGWRIGKPSGEYLEIKVADTGTGMTPEIVGQIFEPFFTTKMEGQGTGLGLHIVYGIVEKNGGDIAVDSLPGKGTAFRICFPRAITAAAAVQAEPEKSKGPLGGTETILLVEDQDTLRKITATLLRDCGYTVLEADDGAAALKLWAKTSSKVALVMTDIIMPGISGPEMVREMKNAGSMGQTKVLFVSGYSEKRLSGHEFELNSVNFLEKPYTADELLGKLREVLDD